MNRGIEGTLPTRIAQRAVQTIVPVRFGDVGVVQPIHDIADLEPDVHTPVFAEVPSIAGIEIDTPRLELREVERLVDEADAIARGREGELRLVDRPRGLAVEGQVGRGSPVARRKTAAQNVLSMPFVSS